MDRGRRAVLFNFLNSVMYVCAFVPNRSDASQTATVGVDNSFVLRSAVFCLLSLAIFLHMFCHVVQVSVSGRLLTPELKKSNPIQVTDASEWFWY